MKEPVLRNSALLTGLFFSILICAFSPYNNIKLQNSPLGGGHFPLGSFGVLLLLMAANPLLSRIGKNWRFHYRELVLIWSMTAVSSGIAYTGLIRTFLINITTPGWLNLHGEIGKEIVPYASSYLFPGGAAFIRSLYGGLNGGMEMSWLEVAARVPWGVWLAPFLLWALFILFVYSAVLGVVGLFSHQWIENEKMNFPLIQVPEFLSREADRKTLRKLFCNRYLIAGLAIPFILHGLNGLHTYFPEVPRIPTVLLAQPYIPREGILAGLYKVKVYIIPAFVGFAFLASRQVSLSFWFFFVMGGLLPGLLAIFGWKIPSTSLGTVFGPVSSRVEETQMIGAFAVSFIFIVWLSRFHLLAVLRDLTGGEGEREQFHGLISPGASAFLLCGGLIGAAAWLWYFGMDFAGCLCFLAAAFMLQIVSSRLICQGGLPYFTLTLAPSDGFLTLFGTQFIQPATLYLGAVVQKVTFVDLRESIMPSLFHASKLSDGSRPGRRFLWGILIAIACGVLVSFVAMLMLYYRFGISGLPDTWAVESTRKVHESAALLLKHPEGFNSWVATFSIAGGIFMSLLIMGYHHFIWWPLHPIGYLTAYSSAMQILWFGFFAGWFCNTLVIRYGGVNLYREVKLLFIGLIAGDMLMAILWLVVGIFAPVSYHVLPL